MPIPARLVQRIQALDFVDMRKLLPENITPVKRLVELQQGLAPPKLLGEREITGDHALATWVSSFAMYAAVVGQVNSFRGGAHAGLIVREAARGNGWLTYDMVFQ